MGNVIGTVAVQSFFHYSLVSLEKHFTVLSPAWRFQQAIPNFDHTSKHNLIKNK